MVNNGQFWVHTVSGCVNLAYVKQFEIKKEFKSTGNEYSLVAIMASSMSDPIVAVFSDEEMARRALDELIAGITNSPKRTFG